jgi:hypothetical protein
MMRFSQNSSVSIRNIADDGAACERVKLEAAGHPSGPTKEQDYADKRGPAHKRSLTDGAIPVLNETADAWV